MHVEGFMPSLYLFLELSNLPGIKFVLGTNVFCFPLVPIFSNGLLANRNLVFVTLAEDLEIIELTRREGPLTHNILIG
jgi:hypothetical protein